MLLTFTLLTLLPAALLFGPDDVPDRDDDDDADGQPQARVPVSQAVAPAAPAPVPAGAADGEAAGDQDGHGQLSLFAHALDTDHPEDTDDAHDDPAILDIPEHVDAARIAGFRPGFDRALFHLDGSETQFTATTDPDEGSSTLHLEHEDGARQITFLGLDAVPVGDISFALTDPVTGAISRFHLDPVSEPHPSDSRHPGGVDFGPLEPDATPLDPVAPLPGWVAEGDAGDPLDPVEPLPGPPSEDGAEQVEPLPGPMAEGDAGEPLDPVEPLPGAMAEGDAGAPLDPIEPLPEPGLDPLDPEGSASDPCLPLWTGVPEAPEDAGVADVFHALRHDGWARTFAADAEFDSAADTEAEPELPLEGGAGGTDDDSGEDHPTAADSDVAGPDQPAPDDDWEPDGSWEPDEVRTASVLAFPPPPHPSDDAWHPAAADPDPAEDAREPAPMDPDALSLAALAAVEHGAAPHDSLADYDDGFAVYSHGTEPAVIAGFRPGQDMLHITFDPSQHLSLPDIHVAPSEDGADGLVVVGSVIVAVLKGAPRARRTDVYAEVVVDTAA